MILLTNNSVRLLCWSSLWILYSIVSVRALEVVTFTRQQQSQTITGKLVTKAEDGGLMLMTSDGRAWTIQPSEIKEHRTNEQPFVPLKSAELAKQLVQELPAGFKVHTTVNYIVAYNTSKVYAEWVGGLLERLHTGFQNYWKKLGFALQPSEFPLVVLVFDSQENYAEFTKQELQGDARQVVAFYSMATNRICLYDLTGAEALRRPGDQRGTAAQINAMLSRPEAQFMVATIIHEATHQLAYNRGLHQRFADVPLWFSEGLAVFFEAPDLRNPRGWSTIGTVHPQRLQQFRTYQPQRPRESLASLALDNKRFLTPQQSLNAYAEAWALHHYLLKAKPKEYIAYLQTLSVKQPYQFDDAETKLKEFQQAFGSPNELGDDLLNYVNKLK
jgi:hypothetical protein